MRTGLIRGTRQVKTALEMPPRPALPLAEQIAAAQAWWREAGVDLAFVDEPQGWLNDPAAQEPIRPPAMALPAEPERPRIGGDPDGWPRDLAAFQRWWLEEQSLDHDGAHPRVAPRGSPGAPLAVLVPMPEAEDAETLLSGPQGRLIASIVQAMGFQPEAVYLTAALPRHTTLPDWAGMAADGLGEVLLHHLGLAAPERLIVLGRDVSPLLGHDPAQSPPAFSELTIQGRKLPLMTSFSPLRLLENPRLRRGVWQRWLDWTEGDMR
jgi:DNA polymerase